MTDNTIPSEEACVWAHDALHPGSGKSRAEKIAWVRGRPNGDTHRLALEYDRLPINVLTPERRDKLRAILRGVDSDDARELAEALDPMDPAERAAREYFAKRWTAQAGYYSTVPAVRSADLRIFIAGWNARDEQEQGQ